MTGLRLNIRWAALLAVSLFASTATADTWMLFEETITLDQPVTDDAFLLANELTLSSTFSEDLWAAGRKIDYTGTTQDDVRMLGLEVVNLNGRVEGQATLISTLGNVVLSSNAVVAADAVLQAGKRISLTGTVKGNVWAEAPRIVVEGDIGGNLTVRSQNIQLLPGAVIRGDLINRGAQPLPVPEGVTVMGQRLDEPEEPSEVTSFFAQLKWILKALQFVTASAVGLLLLKLFPKFTGQNIDLILNRQGPFVSIGLFAFVLLVLAGYFLLFTVIGIGVGLFILLVTGLMFYLGKLFMAFAIGMILLKQTSDLSFWRCALALIIGLTVLYTLGSIPYIGASLTLLASCWGLGALLVSLRLSQKAVALHIPDTHSHDNP